MESDVRTLADILATLVKLGAKQIYAKLLAPNDNSKNQPYLAKGSLAAMNLFPVGAVQEHIRGKRPTFSATLSFYWLLFDGSLEHAPRAQLIAYPKYPEVRLSGFLAGAPSAPRLMAERLPGRILLLGVTDDRRVLAVLLHPQSVAAKEVSEKAASFQRQGVLLVLPTEGRETSRDRLLRILGEIHREGWTDSVRLSPKGLVPCVGTNGGGCTLEAMLGVVANSISGPDFEDWEVKGHRTANFRRLASGRVTLMTPGPTGGFYKRGSVVDFVTRFGYPDSKIPGRINFSSPHRVGVKNKRTQLTAVLSGFDPAKRLVSQGGALSLITDTGEIAISWDFAALFQMWTTKHSKTAFVPYMARKAPGQQYAYGDLIGLAQGADVLRFLEQLALGHITYDPGIWILNGKPGKARSQFRVPGRYVPDLYENIEHVLVFES